ncbi:MAG: hypothetical protein LBQ06_00250 [Frankiaceae bacterium]|jgi:hypothetical protein|nr:hypothetical protein [Frankiaceae bacterium]
MSTSDLDIAQRHALQTLAADIDALRGSLDATTDALRWDSASAVMLRGLAHDLSADMRKTAYQLRALL